MLYSVMYSELWATGCKLLFFEFCLSHAHVLLQLNRKPAVNIEHMARDELRLS
jgi:hypothetical protein